MKMSKRGEIGQQGSLTKTICKYKDLSIIYFPWGTVLGTWGSKEGFGASLPSAPNNTSRGIWALRTILGESL